MMKNNKKTLIIAAAALALLCVVVVVLIVSFGGQKVAICLRKSDGNNAYANALKEKLEDNGYRVHVVYAANDQSYQNSQIAELIEDEYAFLFVEPVMVDTAQALAEQAKQAQIPMIFINYEPSEETFASYDKLSYVGCQDKNHGYLQAKIAATMLADINGDGTVSYLVIAGPEDNRIAQAQAAGYAEGFAEADVAAECLAVKWGQWTAESGRMDCAEALAQYGKDIEVIFCGNDAMALGALEAIWAGGWSVGQDFLLIGFGGSDGAHQAIQMGNMSATMTQDLEAQTQKALEVMELLLDGQTVENQYYVNCKPITRG